MSRPSIQPAEPKAYLITFHEEIDHKWRDSLVIRARCYTISLPQLERYVEYNAMEQSFSLDQLTLINFPAVQILNEERGRMARMLIEKAPVLSEQDCVLLPRTRYDAINKAWERAERFRRLWKRAAKSFFNRLMEIPHGP